jgi:hypothetical protein
LNTDNTLDGPITPQAAISGPVRALVATADDSFIAGGQFTVLNQIPRSLFKLAAPTE